jgi:hypothetical protein
MSQYQIEVSRISYACLTLNIEADSQGEAEDKAMDEAGDHVFSEHSSEYSLTNGTQDDERVAAETSAEQALVDKVIEEIKANASKEDYTAIEEMLFMLLRKQGEPQHILTGYAGVI